MSDCTQKRAAELARITDRQWQHMVTEGVLQPTAGTAGFTRGKTKLYSPSEIGIAKALAPFIRMNLSPEMLRKIAAKIRPLWTRIAEPGGPNRRLLRIAMYRDEPFVALTDIVSASDYEFLVPQEMSVSDGDEASIASFAAFDVVIMFDVFNLSVVHGPLDTDEAVALHRQMNEVDAEKALLDEIIERESASTRQS